MQTLFGGSKQSSSSSSSSGGFNELPQEIKDFFTKLATQATGFIGDKGDQAFTPIEQTAGETNAINNINKGFTPDQNQLNSDIAMQQNPWDNSVLNTINNQANGQYSVLKQAQNQAGQVGSNRGLLGANDIDMQRLNQIGTFKQGQFDRAMGNALTVMPQSRMMDASNQLQAGGFQRNLNLQGKQAPFSNMAALSQILGIMPKVEGTSTSQSSGSGSSSNGLFGGDAGTLLAAKALGFSDVSMKENIIPIGVENGHNIYEFNYKGNEKKYIGVMAHEVEEINPSAVVEINGHKAVNYNAIGVKFREAA